MYFTIPCIVSILCLYGASTDNMTDYIRQLEMKISVLESHSLASEQKQAADLASFLSKVQVQEQKQATVQANILSKLQSQEQELQELKTELDNATKIDCTPVSTSGLQPVVFEASTSHDLRTTGRIYFNKISMNVGGAYSSHTGVFTAPRSGTYQFWFSVYLDLPTSYNDPVVKLTGGAGTIVYGSYVPPKQHGDDGPRNAHRVIQSVLAVSLVKGDPVYLTMSPPTTVNSASSFGGVFLGHI